jgi:hypothetical protein
MRIGRMNNTKMNAKGARMTGHVLSCDDRHFPEFGRYRI